MESKKCPKCGLINHKIALWCDCGYDFKAAQYKNGVHPISNRERILTATAHAAVILPVIGLIIPFIIWIIYKNKSNFVAFHAERAETYQLILAFAWIGAIGCFPFSILSSFPLGFPGFLIAMSPIGVLVLILITMVMVLYGLMGANMAWQGKAFHYRINGPQVEEYKEQPKLISGTTRDSKDKDWDKTVWRILEIAALPSCLGISLSVLTIFMMVPWGLDAPALSYDQAIYSFSIAFCLIAIFPVVAIVVGVAFVIRWLARFGRR